MDGSVLITLRQQNEAIAKLQSLHDEMYEEILSYRRIEQEYKKLVITHAEQIQLLEQQVVLLIQQRALTFESLLKPSEN